MEIKPTYVTFEQAKLLNNEISCESKYDSDGFLFQSKDYNLTGSKFIDSISAPEQWQVVEWLRVKHGIWVSVTQELGATITYCYLVSGEHYSSVHKPYFKSPQEAYSAAFDYVLKELI